MSFAHVFKRENSLTEDQRERRDNSLQAANVIMLGLAAVAAAFAGYRAAILGGDAILDYTSAARTVNESSQAFIEGNQVYALDQAIFLEYAKAAVEGDEDLAQYFKLNLGSEQLTVALDAWERRNTDLNPDNDVDSPFLVDAYTIEQYATGEELLAQTNALFETGQENDDRGDKFDLAVAVLATALFMYGISAVSRKYSVQLSSLVFGTALFAGAVAYMISI